MKKLLVILLLLISCDLYSQDKKPFFAAVIVSNIDTSVHWYSKVLGLSIRNRTELPERKIRQANLHNENMLLELIQVEHSIGEGQLLEKHAPNTRIIGYAKIGFVVKDIEVLYDQFKKQNIKFTGRMVTDPVNNKRTFLINDPDDNLVQFFEQ